MRYLVSSAVFGLIPVPPEANASSGERGKLHVTHGDVQHPQSDRLSSVNTERLATKAELARLRRELDIRSIDEFLAGDRNGGVVIVNAQGARKAGLPGD